MRPVVDSMSREVHPMSDINTFIDAISQDVTAVVAPKIDGLSQAIGASLLNDYGPRISTFASQLVNDLVRQQSAVVRGVVIGLIHDLSERYRPELAGELHARIVQGGVEITGRDVRVDLKRRDTGSVVSSVDVPVSLVVKIDPLSVTFKDEPIGLEVVR